MVSHSAGRTRNEGVSENRSKDYIWT